MVLFLFSKLSLSLVELKSAIACNKRLIQGGQSLAKLYNTFHTK